MSKKTETRPSTGHINPFGLRMQPDLRARLEAAAAASGRSLNAEICQRLEDSLPPTYFRSDDPLAPLDQVTRLTEHMNEILRTIVDAQAAMKEELARRDALEQEAAETKSSRLRLTRARE